MLFTIVFIVIVRALSLVLGALDPSAHLNRDSYLSLLLEPPLCRIALSLWGVPRPGMASLWSFALFLGPSLPRSLLTLKRFFLAVLESGAPLSSFLEGALYKCSI